MAYDPDSEHSFLTDFIYLPCDANLALCHWTDWTGTIPFMAIDLLTGRDLSNARTVMNLWLSSRFQVSLSRVQHENPSVFMLAVQHVTYPTRSPPQTHRQKASGIKSKSRDIMFSRSQNIISGGTFISNENRTSRGMDILMDRVATGAFHNSRELYDAPKCHPHTRIAVLDDIMKWAGKSESARDDFMLWLFGPAGAGKSAIAKRIAEIAAEMDMLIATFFFSRTSSTRRTADRLIGTLAYQLALSIPETRYFVEHAIERDPVIFDKDIRTQIDTLLIRPLQSIPSTQTTPSQKLIIIDGLDECNDSQAQVAILEAISRSFPQHKLPIIFLIASRPEIDLVTSFNYNEPLRSIHRRLALDNTYRPDDDIRLFFSDKFEHIRLTHPLRSTIPNSWPTQEMLNTLVLKSSGQFLYASTVVKFVESSCHRPGARLDIILGISTPGKTNPFAELDALYNHLLSSVEDIQIALRVLSLYVMTPTFASGLHISISPELFLSLEPGDIELALINLSSIVTYHKSPGAVKVLHASFVDFLSDKNRSTIYYIDMASTCIGFFRRILQYVKGPDGIHAGDIGLFGRVIGLRPWMSKGQIRNDILNFDLDAFINASIRRQYKEHPYRIRGSTIDAFNVWKNFLDDVALEDRDKKEALDRLKESFESRLQKYQSDWRLKLLLSFKFAVTEEIDSEYKLNLHVVPYCRCLDILLEMDDHDLHLVDQGALDLRHAYMTPWKGLIGMSIRRAQFGHFGRKRNTQPLPTLQDLPDLHAIAALHCMRFLSNPPKYSEGNEIPEVGLIYAEWKATCTMTLDILFPLLRIANTSSELVQFISNHNIHPTVQRDFPDKRVNECLLAFLMRAKVCPSWTTIPLLPIITRQQSSKFEEENEWGATRRLIRQRLDHCCLNVH